MPFYWPPVLAEYFLVAADQVSIHPCPATEFGPQHTGIYARYLHLNCPIKRCLRGAYCVVDDNDIDPTRIPSVDAQVPTTWMLCSDHARSLPTLLLLHESVSERRVVCQDADRERACGSVRSF